MPTLTRAHSDAIVDQIVNAPRLEADKAAHAAGQPPTEQSPADQTPTDEVQDQPFRPTTRRNCIENLKCMLTESERLSMGSDLARVLSAAQSDERAMKDTAAEYKSKIAGHTSKAIALSKTMNEGYEYRDVDCTEILDYENATVTTTRNDTGEVINTRPMRGSEMQTTMPLETDDKDDTDDESGIDEELSNPFDDEADEALPAEEVSADPPGANHDEE